MYLSFTRKLSLKPQLFIRTNCRGSLEIMVIILNSLKTKKEMAQGLRHNKTERNDVYHFTIIQRFYHHLVSQLQMEKYHQLML